MFTYCNNCPVKYRDTNGYSIELAIRMYERALTGIDDECEFTSDDPIGKRMSHLLSKSSAFESAIQDSVPSIPWDAETVSGQVTLDPYSFDNAVDKEISLAVGYATVSYECTYREFQTFTEYHVNYTISDDYNFEFWGADAHKSGITKIINNYGGAIPMQAGILHEYSWSYSGSYSFRRNNNAKQSGGGGGTRRIVRC